jgi:hypothetical protein
MNQPCLKLTANFVLAIGDAWQAWETGSELRRHRPLALGSAVALDALADFLRTQPALQAHRGRAVKNVAISANRRPIHHASAVETRPGGMSTATRAARLVPDEHPARFKPMHWV